jgi:hypothetical protein
MSTYWHQHALQILAAGVAASLVFGLITQVRLSRLRKKTAVMYRDQERLAWHLHRRMLIAMGVDPDDYTRSAAATRAGQWDRSGRYGPDRGTGDRTRLGSQPGSSDDDATSVLPYVPLAARVDAGGPPGGDVISTGEDGGRWFRIPGDQPTERIAASPVRHNGWPPGYA